jgi:cullin 3
MLLSEAINFIISIGAKDVYYQIIENKQNKIIDNFTKLSAVSLNTEEEYFEYINKFNLAIQEESFKFKMLFGEQNAFKLKEALTKIIFIEKIPYILSNKAFIDSLILKKNFSILNLIYKLMNTKIDNLVLLQDKLFETFVNKFYDDLKHPTNIKEGLAYIDYVLSRLDLLDEIYNIAFNKDRRIQIKYKETIERIINNKHVKNISLLCSIYINEIIITNDLEHIKIRLNKLTHVLMSLGERENFFAGCQKYLIKRISTWKYNAESELYLINYLRNIFGNRYCFQLYRILNDIKESRNFFKGYLKNKPENEINLLSFNSLHGNDMVQVLDLPDELDKSKNDFISVYTGNYPHRIITVSQQQSSCLLDFKVGTKSYELLTNFIQVSILLVFNKHKSLAFTELTKYLNVKNMPLFRPNLNHLISSHIILVKDKEKGAEFQNDDILILNNGFISNKDKIDLTYVKIEHNLNIKDSEHGKNELDSINTFAESLSVIYKTNENYILDCRIMMLLKAYKTIEQQSLIKAVLNETKTYFQANVALIHKRLESLMEKGFIHRQIEDEKVMFRYFDK